jgi:predicted DNA binding protein
MPKEADEDVATRTQNSSGTKLRSRQPNSVQRATYIRGNNNKKKIKEADFPAEAPQSNSYKYEASNAEHSVYDLSFECPKECSLTDTNESCDCAKNDGANQAQKHSVPRGIQKNLSLSRGS